MFNQNIIQDFLRFKSMFNGNAQEEVQNLLKSGKVTQDQYNEAVQKAQQLLNLINTSRR